MTLDILAVSLGLVFAFLGWRSGATAQCLRLGAALVSFFAAAPAARLLRETFFPSTNISGPVLEGVFLVGAGIAVYTLLSLAAWLFVRAIWAASDSLTVLDRAGGMGLGLLKASVLVYFLVASVAVMRGTLREVDEEDALHIRDSRVLAMVDRYNILVPWRFGDLQRLHDAIKVERAVHRGPRRAAEIVRGRTTAADFLRSDEMERLTSSPALVEAAVRDRYYSTLADPEVREVLNDDTFVVRLRRVEWDSILAKVRSEASAAAGVAAAP